MGRKDEAHTTRAHPKCNAEQSHAWEWGKDGGYGAKKDRENQNICGEH